MSADENTQTETPERSDEGEGEEQDDNTQTETPERSDEDKEQDENTETETPELSDEGKEQVKQMRATYDDDRQTAVLPGTDGTITGVAVNEWLDDDGNPKFGKDEQKKKDEEQDKPQEEDKQQDEEQDKPQEEDKQQEDAS